MITWMNMNATTTVDSKGGMTGTPYFMAPEAIDSDTFGPCGRRSDVWSLGGFVFQMVVGRPPWKALKMKSPYQLFARITRSTNEVGGRGRRCSSDP